MNTATELDKHDKHDKHAKHGSTQERMEQIIREGQFYRTGVLHAKEQIKYGAKPDTLFHSALDHATFAVRSRVDGLLKPTGISVATVMPYAVTVLGIIRKRRLGKPALAATVVMAAIGWYLQRRRAQQFTY